MDHEFSPPDETGKKIEEMIVVRYLNVSKVCHRFLNCFCVSEYIIMAINSMFPTT